MADQNVYEAKISAAAVKLTYENVVPAKSRTIELALLVEYSKRGALILVLAKMLNPVSIIKTLPRLRVPYLPSVVT